MPDVILSTNARPAFAKMPAATTPQDKMELLLALRPGDRFVYDWDVYKVVEREIGYDTKTLIIRLDFI